jgi:hypothetical protein
VTLLRTLLRGRRHVQPVARPANRSDRRGPGRRGWSGNGEDRVMVAPDRFRASTNHVCGMWPFAVGSGAPLIGVPLGRHLRSALGTAVCCDPISWFQRARLISNPSEFVLGLPGLGKSTVVRRQVLGLHGNGVNPLVLGDLKPDYVDLIRAIDGQVITIGPGQGHINILDPGDAMRAAARLEKAAEAAASQGEAERAEQLRQARRAVLAEAHTRRTTVLGALMTILRGGKPPEDREEAIFGAALRIADARAAIRVGVPWAPGANVPVVGDLLDVIRDAPPEVRRMAIDRGNRTRYDEIVEPLEATLVALSDENGRFGTTFARHTTTRMRLDRPVVYDVSRIDDSQMDYQAATLLACWSAGFGAVNIANVLADFALEPRRHYFVVMDELWRALRAGRGMVDRVDALSRLNRQRGVGVAMVSHTMSDLLALPSHEDRMKAKGLVERAGLLLLAGLPESEFDLLDGVVRFSRAEKNDLTSWTDPPAWDQRLGREAPPPGRGKFLIKVGGRPGIPLRVDLTAVEIDLALNDTNKLWHDVSRIGLVHDAEEPVAA